MTYDGGNTSTIAYPLAIVFLNIHPKLSVHVINGCWWPCRDRTEFKDLYPIAIEVLEFRTYICTPQVHKLKERIKTETLDGININAFVLLLLPFHQ